MKRFLARTGIPSECVRLASAFRAPRAVIIRYHSIQAHIPAESAVVPPGICHTSGQLRAHLAVLKRHFNVFPLPELVARLAAREPMPPRSVVITFDDGFADNWTVAAPILDEFGIKASFFLTTGLIGTRDVPWFCATRWVFQNTKVSDWTEPTFGRHWNLDTPKSRDAARYAANLVCAAATAAERAAYLEELQRQLEPPPMQLDSPLMLDWQQAKALLAAGHHVDSHSVTHPNMALLSRADAQWEAAESRRQLQAQLGAGGHVFCYPNPFGKPNTNTLTREVLRAAGYSAALLVDPGTIDAATDALALPRIAVPEDPAIFRLSIERHFAGLV